MVTPFCLVTHDANMELLHVNSSREEKPHMELSSPQFAPVLFVWLKYSQMLDVIAMI